MVRHLKKLLSVATLFLSGIHAQTGQQVALASYISPGNTEDWNRLVGYPQNKLSVLVANVINGPNNEVNPGWADVISRAAASGKTVIGYVRTGYLGASNDHYTTRLGSAELADWVAQIEEDVDMWYNLYGNNIGGIFFDEGLALCGTNNEYADIYTHINRYTKARHPGAFTVLNPGTAVPQCYEHAVDTLLTFEGDHTTYINSYVGNDWTAADIRKIWHIVYQTPEAEVSNVAALALTRGAGLIEITDDVYPNPYDNLPSDSYMQTELNAVAGGDPLIEAAPYPSGPAASTPTNLQVTSLDYSAAHLTWSPAANAIGYQVYLDNNLVASVTSAMTAVTIGGLQNSTTYTVTVAALGGGGVESGRPNSVTFTTLTLPEGKTVINMSSTPSPTSTTIRADVLLPYGFVRIYLYDTISCDWQNDPAWPITYNASIFVCARYMVEGTTLYRYNATPPVPNPAPSTWVANGTVTDEVRGRNHTWTLPIGTSTIDTSKFVVQVEGYSPSQNVFQPDPPRA